MVAKPPARRTGRLYLWVPQRWQVDVHYLTEAYEGLLVPTTLESKVGLMAVMVAPGREAEAEEVLAALVQACPGTRVARRRPEEEGSCP